MSGNRIATELLDMAREVLAGDREIVASPRWVREVVLEMKELKKLGIRIPHKKFDEKKIEQFFGPEGATMGNSELSGMVDAYLMM